MADSDDKAAERRREIFQAGVKQGIALGLRRYFKFMELTKGMPNTHVARMLNKLTSGINWMGCAKSHMAQEFAKGYRGMDKINEEKLAELVRRAKAYEAERAARLARAL